MGSIYTLQARFFFAENIIQAFSSFVIFKEIEIKIKVGVYTAYIENKVWGARYCVMQS